VDLTAAQARAVRLHSQLLAGADAPGRPTDVAGVATWFGALQAQDLASVMWSLGVRLAGWTAADVHAALERREALRTWPMRGTVHLVPARDAHWMLDLLGTRALAGSAKRRATLGIAEQVVDRAVQVLADALAGGRRLTRSHCLATLVEAGVPVTGQAGYHLLWYASQRGVICIAPNLGNEQSFVLLDDWVPDPVRLNRTEALATIARRYVRSHGPTTRNDFAGWTGLSTTEASQALTAAGDAITTVEVTGTSMLVDAQVLERCAGRSIRDLLTRDLLALPGFDEFMLGYKDRSLVLAPEHQQAIVPGGNGVFQATIVRAGSVVGTWRRSIAGRRTDVSVRPFVPIATSDRTRVESAMQRYAAFIGKPLRLTWLDTT
jgi:winged helix DNA-binding protein